jgi:hypothetical protein
MVQQAGCTHPPVDCIIGLDSSEFCAACCTICIDVCATAFVVNCVWKYSGIVEAAAVVLVVVLAVVLTDVLQVGSKLRQQVDGKTR